MSRQTVEETQGIYVTKDGRPNRGLQRRVCFSYGDIRLLSMRKDYVTLVIENKRGRGLLYTRTPPFPPLTHLHFLPFFLLFLKKRKRKKSEPAIPPFPILGASRGSCNQFDSDSWTSVECRAYTGSTSSARGANRGTPRTPALNRGPSANRLRCVANVEAQTR